MTAIDQRPEFLDGMYLRAIDKDGNTLYSFHGMQSHHYSMLPALDIAHSDNLKEWTRILSWPDAGVGSYLERGPLAPPSAARWHWLVRGCPICGKPPLSPAYKGQGLTR